MRTPFDQIPEYEMDFSSPLPLKDVQIYEKNDFQDFLIHHHGHQLEELRIIEDSFVSEKEYFEPVKVSYFKATNGKEKFVIKKYRKRADEPLKYELIHGDYFLKFVSLEIQEDGIRKELKKLFKSPTLSPNKIEKFIKLYRNIASQVDLKNLEVVNEGSTHPLVAFYKIDDINLAYLLRNCRNIFNKQEYSQIESFIHEQEDGVLLFKAVFQIQIKEISKRKTAISNALLEKKIAIKKE